MSTPQLERLREHCHQLRLYQVENELTARLEQAAKKEISYAEFLDELLALEVGSKAQKHYQMGIAMASLPVPEDPGELRLQVPAFDRSQADPRTGEWPLHAERR